MIINKLGDLIVRPSPLEASLRVLPLQGSVNHHLLTSYLDSIVSVFVSQFSKQQRESGTMARIVEIVRHDKPLKVCLACPLPKPRALLVNARPVALSCDSDRTVVLSCLGSPVFCRGVQHALTLAFWDCSLKEGYVR